MASGTAAASEASASTAAMPEKKSSGRSLTNSLQMVLRMRQPSR